VPGADDTTAFLKEVTTELEIGAGTVLEGQQMIELIEGLLGERAHPEYETVMVAKAAPPQTYDGVRGFREAMTDWLSPWAEFRFEVEEVIPVDDMLLLLVRQTGMTKHGGVEVTTESGTVWWAPEGRIRRATFYLDRRDALKAAGLAAPDRP
jgi:ketosteroid isomerase-like protein